MATTQTCSWCHATNTLTGSPVYCGECGHRADVPRFDCDCPRCGSARRWHEIEQGYDDDYDPRG